MDIILGSLCVLTVVQITDVVNMLKVKYKKALHAFNNSVLFLLWNLHVESEYIKGTIFHCDLEIYFPFSLRSICSIGFSALSCGSVSS